MKVYFVTVEKDGLSVICNLDGDGKHLTNNKEEAEAFIKDITEYYPDNTFTLHKQKLKKLTKEL